MTEIANNDLETRLNFVLDTLASDSLLMSILLAGISGEISGWLGAGCVNQRIWNRLTDRDITYGIDDYDLVYYSNDISKDAQEEIQQEYTRLFPNINIECTNQARVHLWVPRVLC